MNLPKILESYGLSDKQARTYLACLELGSASVQQIALKARLSRSTVYEVLEHLAHEGFVSTFNKKKIKYFSAEDPDQVMRLAERKVNTLKDALPELRAITGASRRRPTVRFYLGTEQMEMVLDEILDEATELIAFGVSEDLLNLLGPYHKTFIKKRVAKKIPLRLLARDSSKARERKIVGPQELRTVRILPATHVYHGLIYIWKNKIAMFAFTGDLVCVVTESKELADMERAMFEHLWERA